VTAGRRLKTLGLQHFASYNKFLISVFRAIIIIIIIIIIITIIIIKIFSILSEKYKVVFFYMDYSGEFVGCNNMVDGIMPI
jgi:hypothetical protein